ncbi:MAG: type VI secretion system contractile sheath large subunit [Deltaproteobacteria bacterium]|jgi:type VI secretion system protein ImpC|nr:type VI secretion system contractile sheath large subunit [Deltaproteobacteria bacterium]
MAPETQTATASEAVAQKDESLLDQIISATSLNPQDEPYQMAKEGLAVFIAELAATNRTEVKISGGLVDELIADLDRKISSQIDAILHQEDFQKMESSWRSLKFLVDRTNFRENVRVNIMNVSKEDLLTDFEDSPEISKSGLYKQVYTAEYGQFGGQPFGAIVANYEFGPGAQDIKLLSKAASVATMAHAPFIAAASSRFFGIERWTDLPNLKDLKSVFDQPIYAKWQSFRTSEDARNVCLTMPKFLLRLPFSPDNPTKTFNYVESVEDPDLDFCWGNTAFALATRLTESFANFRWCANIIGPQGGGSVDDLPLHRYEDKGETHNKIPTQTLISERREFELAEEGFCALTMRKGSDNASFFSANSCLKPKVFPATPEGKEAETNYQLSIQLPYMMIMSRLAHYIKVLQRENIGSWKERNDLERELNVWISQYVTEMDNPEPSVRGRRPLRMAAIEVNDVEGEPGWYQVGLKVRPHFKYMGASFTLSLVGRLDKK